MTDITEIKRKLEGKALEVAEYLLPRGVRHNRDWCVGSVGGEVGESLKVCISGTKIGAWADFAAGGESGDLIDLWCQVKHLSLVQALDDIRAWLGMEMPAFQRRETEYRRPERPKCAVPKSAVLAYLTGQRLLTMAAIRAYHVGEADKTIVFPSLLPDGTLAFVKYLNIDRSPEGKKNTRVEAGCEPALFGWPAIDSEAREVTITEGEIDAMTGWDYGFPAMSVPFGGGGGQKQRWIESEYDRMSRFEVIYLALDMDAEGNVAAEEIANRLGRHRCRRVELPKKDLNECRKAGVSAEDIRACFAKARSLDPPELMRPTDFSDAVVNLFWPSNEREAGYRLPFEKVGDKLVFRPGELSEWTGATGAGKALALDTPIPTLSGWTTMGEIKAGDTVFDENGLPCSVIATTPTMHDRPCYAVKFDTGDTVIADADHEWLTGTRQARSSSIVQRKKRGGREETLKRGTDQRHKMTLPSVKTTRQIAETLHYKTWRNHQLNCAGPLNCPAADLPIDPYVLGVWLGDGTSSDGSITSADLEIVDNVRARGYVAREQPSRAGRTGLGYGLLGLKKILGSLGLINNKHIPSAYLRGSQHQRAELLAGLMDTDGYCAPGRSCEFTSVSSRLANQVLELALSLGLKATISCGPATLNGRIVSDKYRVHFTTAAPVFHLSRKLARLPVKRRRYSNTRMVVGCQPVASVPVRCIQVDSPSHLYLAGRGMIPTHNSQILSYGLVGMAEQGARICLASLEMSPAQLLRRMVKQAGNIDRPTERYVRDIVGWMDAWLWMFGLMGKTAIGRLIEVFEYARCRYGCDVFAIDSLMRLGVSSEDYEGQEKAVFEIVNWAVAKSVHVHLVAHSRKSDPRAGHAIPDVEDVKGTSEIASNAANIIGIWRNKKLEDEIRQASEGVEKGEADSQLKLDDLAQKPTVIINVAKQRNGDWEGKFGVWFSPITYQYRSSHDRSEGRKFAPDTHYDHAAE